MTSLWVFSCICLFFTQYIVAEDGGSIPFTNSLRGKSSAIIDRVMENMLTTDDQRKALLDYIAEATDTEFGEVDQYVTCLECRVSAKFNHTMAD